MSDLDTSLKNVHDSISQGKLLETWGTRSLAWRIFLGVLSDGSGLSPDQIKTKWVTETKVYRKKHADLHHSLSIKALAAQIPAGFNPLAPAPV